MQRNKKVEKIAEDVKSLLPAGKQVIDMTIKTLDSVEKQQTIDNIRDLDLEIFQSKANIKQLRERTQEIKEGHLAYNEMVKAQDDFAAAKEKLRIALLSDSDYNDTMENLAEERAVLADKQDILSLHIVEYYTQTHARQVEIDDNGDAREILVTGKLGSKGKFQTDLFSSSDQQPKLNQEKLI